jgi:uncharacterized protein DUF1302
VRPSSLPRLRAVIRPTLASSTLLAALALAATPARAFEVTTGDPDLDVRFDNTVRYSLGVRAQGQDPAILGNPNYDDGDRNFKKGQLIANRIDLLSEFDLVYKKNYGLRVSGAAWGDAAYSNLNNTNTATANTLVNGVPTAGVLSSVTSRYAKGPSGELLDAFVFANNEIAETPVNFKVGRFVTYWGEGLLLGSAVHGISYGQYSIDLWKGLATPGAETKELFRPRAEMTLQVQPRPDLSLTGQLFGDWEHARYPESGSYLTVNDALLDGGDSLIAGPGQRLLQGDQGTPNKFGDWGLSSRWSPEWLNGTLGVYVRRTADIQPQLGLIPAVAALPAARCSAAGLAPLGATTCYINPAAASIAQIQAGQIGQYRAFYGRDIDMLGLSLSQNIAGISVSGELNVRHNMPLNSIPVTVLPAALVNPAAGQIATTAVTNDTPGARGNTLHGVLNFVGVTSKTPLFDTAAWIAELTYNRWLSVSQNAAAFKGSDAYRANPANVDAVSKDFVGLGLNFTPTWFQVLPSVDLSMPLSISGGLVGNSAVMTGGNKNNGQYGFGLAADIQSKYNVALRYVGFYGNYSTTAAGAMNVPQSTFATLSDRGFVMLTLKTTF